MSLHSKQDITHTHTHTTMAPHRWCHMHIHNATTAPHWWSLSHTHTHNGKAHIIAVLIHTHSLSTPNAFMWKKLISKQKSTLNSSLIFFPCTTDLKMVVGEGLKDSERERERGYPTNTVTWKVPIKSNNNKKKMVVGEGLRDSERERERQRERENGYPTNTVIWKVPPNPIKSNRKHTSKSSMLSGLTHSQYTLRVPDQNGVSQAWYTVEIHHSGRKPSTYSPECSKCSPADPLQTH